MTPITFSILLHYKYSGVDYRDGDFAAPAVREGIDWLRSEQLLECTRRDPRAGYGATYQLTARGSFYVDACLATPLPVAETTWRIPPGELEKLRGRVDA